MTIYSTNQYLANLCVLLLLFIVIDYIFNTQKL